MYFTRLRAAIDHFLLSCKKLALNSIGEKLIMKVFITGGAGFIGKWLVRSLPFDCDIVLLDSIDGQVHSLIDDFSEDLKSRALCIKADIRDQAAYVQALEGSDAVVHLASQTGTGQSMYEISKYVQHNVDGTANFLEAISSLKQKPRRIVLSSSRAVYGEGAFSDGDKVIYGRKRQLKDLQSGKWETYNEDGQEISALPMREDQLLQPTSIYGLTKQWQEDLIKIYAQNQHIDYAILRLQNVYGPGQELQNPYTGIIGIFTSLIYRKGKVELFEDGKMTRDFVYVADVAAALKSTIYCQQEISKTINVGNGKPTSLNELVRVICDISNSPAEIEYSGRFRVGDIRHAVADMELYKETFGSWNPTSLEVGIRQYLEWYQNQEPLPEEKLSASLKEMENQKMLLKSK